MIFNTEITGKKVGSLTAVERLYVKDKKAYWLCKCDCGGEKIVRTESFNFGKVRSCGCLAKKMIANKEYEEVFYQIWQDMKQSCNNKKSPLYKECGEKGIKVCKDWESFLTFKKNMYKSYFILCEKHGVDNVLLKRIDKDKDYSWDNCTWKIKDE